MVKRYPLNIFNSEIRAYFTLFRRAGRRAAAVGAGGRPRGRARHALLARHGPREPPRAPPAEGQPWAVKPLRDGIHYNLLENSCNRVYL